MAIRLEFLRKAEAFSNQGLANEGMSRRWDLQHCRFLFNRLLYLMPYTEYQRLLELLPNAIELNELRVVLTALSTGNGTPLLRRPGPAVSAFAQMWTERGGDLAIDWSTKAEFGTRDSAATLAAYGVTKIPSPWIDGVEKQANQQYLRVLNGETVELNRSVPAYLLELSCLLKPWKTDEIRTIMQERFNNDEDLFLSGLGLGGDYFS
ncbi:MAG: hypothetical protein ACKVP0_03350 [Pirellulaceae bacterium]